MNIQYSAVSLVYSATLPCESGLKKVTEHTSTEKGYFTCFSERLWKAFMRFMNLNDSSQVRHQFSKVLGHSLLLFMMLALYFAFPKCTKSIFQLVATVGLG